MRRGVGVKGCVLAGLLALAAPAVPAAAPAHQLPTILPESLGVEPRERDDKHELPPDTADQLRKDALARALVWLEPKPVGKADLRNNPRDLFDGREEVACKFHPDKTSGSTPKFDCVFAGGEVLEVKYGRSPEIHTEVAAARLLRALGAGADTMYLMRRVPVWKDTVTCLVKIESPPLHGATFGEASISEAGRAYLARRLRRLRTRDVRDLFEGARFAEYAEASGPSRDIDQWVGAFEEKVRQITERAPCPTP